jgi:hypothetical protein
MSQIFGNLETPAALFEKTPLGVHAPPKVFTIF